jgi:hypothetical protein
MDGKNRRHANAFAVRVSIRPIALQWTSGRCHRERITANADISVSAKRKRPLLTTWDRVFWMAVSQIGRVRIDEA